MKLENDQSCSWINDLTKRTNIKSINSNEDCEWLIIGAGYTGLSAARKLGQLNPNQKIILVDAQLAGEGSSGRNSGYLVDTTLNDGFSFSVSILAFIILIGGLAQLGVYVHFIFCGPPAKTTTSEPGTIL